MKTQTKKTAKGFSLIELLIVVAIILIIAAIAIPALLRSKMAANEASAVSSMRSINTASVAYAATYGNYPPTIAALGPAATASATAADLIDSVLSAGSKSGYTFTYVQSGTGPNIGTSYSLVAAPLAQNITGQRGFYTDQSGVIRGDLSGMATFTSTPID